MGTSNRSISKQLSAMACATVYFSSIGTHYNVQWAFQVAWFLSVLFGLLCALQLVGSSGNVSLAIIYFILAWLSFSSNIMAMSLTIAAFLFTYSEQVTAQKLRLSFLIIMAGLCLVLIGSRLASLALPVDPSARGWVINTDFIVVNSSEVLRWTFAATFAWLVAVVLVIPLFDQQTFENLGNFIYRNSHLIAFSLFAILLVFVATRIVVWRTRMRAGTSALLIPMFFFVALLGANLVVVVARLGNVNSFLHIRYAPMMLIPALSFWYLMATAVPNVFSFLVNAVKFFVRMLLRVSAIAGVVLLPVSFRTASDQGRRTDTVSQLENLLQCSLDQENVLVHRTIQPVMSGAEICDVAESIRGLSR